MKHLPLSSVFGPLSGRKALVSISVGVLIVAGNIATYAQVVSSEGMSIAEYKKLSIEELMEIEVTSVSKRPEKLIASSASIQVITEDDIRSSGVTTVPEALKLASNLQVAQVNASQWAISARGFNNVLANKLLVLIDGRVVYTPLYSGVFWDIQNLVLEDIARIEVISGSGGTLWGANAVNGVINITTKNTSETKGLFAEAAVGTEMRGLGSIRYGGQISDKISYRVYGTAFKRDNTIFFPDSIEARDDWQMAQGGLRLDWTVNEKTNVSFQTNLYDGRPDPDGGSPVEAKGTNILGRWNHTISEKSGLHIQMYFDHTVRDFRNGFEEDLKTYDVEAQHRFKAGARQEIVYGGGFMKAFADIPRDAAPDTRDDPGIYSNAVIYVGDLLFDDYYAGRASGGRERAAYLLADLDLLWAHYFRWAIVSDFEARVQELVARGEAPSGAGVSRLYLGLLREYYGPGVAVDDAFAGEWMTFPVSFLSYEGQFWPPAMAAACAIVERKLAFDRALGRGEVDLSYQIFKGLGVDMASPDPYEAVIRRMNARMDELERLL